MLFRSRTTNPQTERVTRPSNEGRNHHPTANEGKDDYLKEGKGDQLLLQGGKERLSSANEGKSNKQANEGKNDHIARSNGKSDWPSCFDLKGGREITIQLTRERATTI